TARNGAPHCLTVWAVTNGRRFKRNDALCHKLTYAVQQGLGSYFGSRLAVGASRQANRKHRSLARLAGEGHVAAHHARELAGDGKSETGAAEALSGRGIGSGEFLEQPNGALATRVRSHRCKAGGNENRRPGRRQRRFETAAAPGSRLPRSAVR